MLISFALPIIAFSGFALSSMAVPVLGNTWPSPAHAAPNQAPHAPKGQASQHPALQENFEFLTPEKLRSDRSLKNPNNLWVRAQPLSAEIREMRHKNGIWDNDDGLCDVIKLQDQKGKVWVSYGKFFRGVHAHVITVSWQEHIQVDEFSTVPSLITPLNGNWTEVSGLLQEDPNDTSKQFPRAAAEKLRVVEIEPVVEEPVEPGSVKDQWGLRFLTPVEILMGNYYLSQERKTVTKFSTT